MALIIPPKAILSYEACAEMPSMREVIDTIGGAGYAVRVPSGMERHSVELIIKPEFSRPSADIGRVSRTVIFAAGTGLSNRLFIKGRGMVENIRQSSNGTSLSLYLEGPPIMLESPECLCVEANDPDNTYLFSNSDFIHIPPHFKLALMDNAINQAVFTVFNKPGVVHLYFSKSRGELFAYTPFHSKFMAFEMVYGALAEAHHCDPELINVVKPGLDISHLYMFKRHRDNFVQEQGPVGLVTRKGYVVSKITEEDFVAPPKKPRRLLSLD